MRIYAAYHVWGMVQWGFECLGASNAREVVSRERYGPWRGGVEGVVGTLQTRGRRGEGSWGVTRTTFSYPGCRERSARYKTQAVGWFHESCLGPGVRRGLAP